MDDLNLFLCLAAFWDKTALEAKDNGMECFDLWYELKIVLGSLGSGTIDRTCNSGYRGCIRESTRADLVW